MLCRRTAFLAPLLVATALWSTAPVVASGAELKGSDVANPKNNKENSTWQFWMELDTLQAYMRMHEYYKKPKQVPGGGTARAGSSAARPRSIATANGATLGTGIRTSKGSGATRSTARFMPIPIPTTQCTPAWRSSIACPRTAPITSPAA